MSDPDRLRLAHLTDPHLPFAEPRGAELLGKRGLSLLNWRTKRRRRQGPEVAEALLADLLAAAPDRIAMTGDLVTFSLAREFAAARGWLERLGPPGRVLVTAGNHEALGPGWSARMAEAWGPYGRGPDGEAPPFRLDAGPAALIVVPTAVATPPFLAAGRVGPAARARAAALIAAARAERRLPVVLMHHPPTAVASRRKGLLDASRTRAALAGAALVLHGHLHRPSLSWIEGPEGRIPVLGASGFATRPGFGEPPGAWRLLEIEAAPGGARVTLHERAITSAGDVRAATPLRFALPGPAGCRGRRIV
ncbi:MAG TPA: metallophosphoesterase [Paracoccaceae bacterium]|nr:metallophosphoesterase [Paracoccaceae bacterium]